MLPTLLLIVIPFGFGIVLSSLFPLSQWYAILIIVPGLLIIWFYSHYGLAPAIRSVSFESWSKYKETWKASWKYNPSKYFEKRGYEAAINEYDYINKLLYIELALIIILTFLFYTLPDSLKKGDLYPLIGDGFYLLQSTLVFTVYCMFFSLIYSYIRSDFKYHFAKACIAVVESKKDEVNKTYYLMQGLSSYNKFLKRTLKLQFDDAMVCSKIISSYDKNESFNLIATSFKGGDKLRPVSCLHDITNLPDKEQFLVKERLSTKIKEVIIILTTVIPVIISIVQLML